MDYPTNFFKMKSSFQMTDNSIYFFEGCQAKNTES